MPRLVVVLPLEPLRTGKSFAVHEWPLHITVVAPFLTDADPAAVGAILAAATSTSAQFTVVAGEDALFGRRQNIPVTTIRESEPLRQLRDRLVEAVRPVAASPDEAAFTGTDFRAHVTMKNGKRVQVDDALPLAQVALVDMAPRADPSGRTVLATVELGTAAP
jgi:2'-5' RNA ligase